MKIGRWYFFKYAGVTVLGKLRTVCGDNRTFSATRKYYGIDYYTVDKSQVIGPDQGGWFTRLSNYFQQD